MALKYRKPSKRAIVSKAKKNRAVTRAFEFKQISTLPQFQFAKKKVH